MANVHVVLVTVAGRGYAGALPIPNSVEDFAETKTSSATSAQCALVAVGGEVWNVTTNGNVWLKFGANPTAVSGAGFYLLAGQSRDFNAAAGDKIAIKDAP